MNKVTIHVPTIYPGPFRKTLLIERHQPFHFVGACKNLIDSIERISLCGMSSCKALDELSWGSDVST